MGASDPFGQVFPADEDFLIGKGKDDRIVRVTLQQRLKGFHEKLVASLHLRIGGRIEAYGSQCRVQSDGEVKQELRSVRGGRLRDMAHGRFRVMASIFP